MVLNGLHGHSTIQEMKYLDFKHLPHGATRRGKPALNKYSSTLTNNHDAPGAKAMLYAAGVPNEEMMQDAPHIGIASVWWEGNPCNMHLLELAKTVKETVKKQGFLAWQYNTIGVSDGITMGSEGMRFSLQSREIIADSIETVTCAQHHDACIAIPGCDKNMPGVVMAMARFNRPAIMIYGGTIMASFSKVLRRRINISTCYEAHGAWTYNTLQQPDDGGDTSATKDEILTDIEQHACPGIGACGGMYTANTMAASIETLGLSLPGSSSTPATSPSKMRECVKAAEAIKICMERNIRPRDVMTKASFENALVITMALGGSTNAVLHLLAMAAAAEVDLTIQDFQRVSDRIPYIADLAPSGKFFMSDLYEIGGIPAVQKLLIAGGLMDGSLMTVTGKTLAQNVESWPSLSQGQTMIRPLDRPIKTSGHITILRGNIAPGGAVAKLTGAEGLIFKGQAMVFDKEKQLNAALNAGLIPESPDIVIVVRYEGPAGGPGMPEQLKASAAIKGAGLENIALITDGRYSGASHGFIVGHIVPEAAAGGPIALIKNGDIITIDATRRVVEVNLTDAELAARRAAWVPPSRPVTRGALAKYAALVGDASHGAVTDMF